MLRTAKILNIYLNTILKLYFEMPHFVISKFAQNISFNFGQIYVFWFNKIINLIFLFI